jgi:hypothetical protein
MAAFVGLLLQVSYPPPSLSHVWFWTNCKRLADSDESIKAERGKRGLELIRQLREDHTLEITIHEEGPRSTGPGVDGALVSLARELNARLMTNDENLAKVARLRGIQVLSLNKPFIGIAAIAGTRRSALPAAYKARQRQAPSDRLLA